MDDHPVNRQLLQELFSRWSLRADVVDSADAAEAAMDAASDEGRPYTLIITDYHMPRRDGDELTAALQSDPRFAAVPVIMLSSIDLQFAEAEVRGRYAVWQTKPIKSSQLMDAIAECAAATAARQLDPVVTRRERRADDEPVSADRKLVLIAEDNRVNQMVIGTMIDASRYETLFASNGAEALALIAARTPDLIIMDVSMPVMDGLEATRRLRAREAERGLPRCPVIAATAHVLEDDRQACRRAGMDDFMSKPIQRVAVNALIERWIGEGDPATSQVAAG